MMNKKKIRLWSVALGIIVFLMVVLPFAVRFVAVRIYSLDTSDIRGSILFVSPLSTEHPHYGIWQLHIAKRTTEAFFSKTESLPEYDMIESFAYSSEHGALLVAAEKTEDRGGGFVRYKLFAKDKEDELCFLGDSDYTTSRYENPVLYYTEPLSLFAVLRGGGISFMSPNTGEVVDKIEFDPVPDERDWGAKEMDWNDDFTQLVYKDSSLVLFDTEDGSKKQLSGSSLKEHFFFNSGFNEMTTSGFRNPSLSKYNIATEKSTKFCSLEDLTDKVYDLTVSPDRKHVAVYCMKPGMFGHTRTYIVLIEIETGKKAIVFEQRYEGLIYDMQWIDE
jgi:hypothetical protein